MAQAFPLPVNRALDTNGITLSGAKLYFYATGTTTPQAVYSDSALTTPHANPVVADAGGLFAPIYLDPADTYRVILKTSADVTVQDVDPVTSAPTAGDIQFDDAASYSTGTVGAELLKTSEVDYGALAAGTTIRSSSQMRFSGDAGGTSDARNAVESVYAEGSNDFAELHVRDLQMEIRNTGTVALAKALTGYVRNGFQGAGASDVTEIRVCEMHPSNECDGTVGTATSYYAAAFDFADGIGDVNYTRGFQCRDQCDVDRLIGEAIGFDCADFTVSTRVSKPTVASFRSLMTSGTARWSFYGSGGAAMCNSGLVRFGDTTEPANQLEVKGFAKLSELGTYEATLGYHEISTSNNALTLAIRNTHASAPLGAQIKFTAAAPDDRTQYFLRASDSGGTKFTLWSDGGATFAGVIELSSLTNAADDAAAASAGVAVNQVYRNGSVLMVRVS